MQKKYNMALQHIYQAQETKYSQLKNEAEMKYDRLGSDSENENESGAFPVPFKVMINGKASSNGFGLVMKSGDVIPRQPGGCCSRRGCVFCCVWSVLFLLGVIGLSVFLHRFIVHVDPSHTISNSQSSLRYKPYHNTTPWSTVDKGIDKRHLLSSYDDFKITEVWHSTFDKLQTETAVRLLDVNSDGVDDIIIGFGTSVAGYNVPKFVCEMYFNGTYPCFGGLQALDGKTGQELWRYYTTNEVFAVNCNGDLDKDGIGDCLVGGRVGVFEAVSGKTGTKLWMFSQADVRDDQMNVYTGQYIQDLDADGIADVIMIHGGDPFAVPSSETRLIGRIIILSGKTGDVIAWQEVPDKRESYFSPLLYTMKNGSQYVIYGTGGETHGGSLWVVPLKDLLKDKIEKSHAIYTDRMKGVMNPPVLVDINKDGTVDMVMPMFGNELIAVDGATLKLLWKRQFNSSESYSVPGTGYFDDDDVPDFMVRFNFGEGFPTYFYSNVTIVSGVDGSDISPASVSSGIANTSPLGVSVQGRGNDLFIYWKSACFGHENGTKSFQFVAGTNVHEQSRSDNCRLRFNTRSYSQALVMGRKNGFPGKEIYNSLDHVDSEYGGTETHRNRRESVPSANDRFARHVGIPDHGGFQRLISTGSLAAPIIDGVQSDVAGDSIDFVFAVFWIYPAKTRLLEESDLACVNDYRRRAKLGLVQNTVDVASNHDQGLHDEGDTAVTYCLEQRKKKQGGSSTTEDGGIVYSSQVAYNASNIHSGKMTVYRYRITGICHPKGDGTPTCGKILPMHEQGWAGYMGTFANGLFNPRRSDESSSP